MKVKLKVNNQFLFTFKKIKTKINLYKNKKKEKKNDKGE
jgi:hypothetical protein